MQGIDNRRLARQGAAENPFNRFFSLKFTLKLRNEFGAQDAAPPLEYFFRLYFGAWFGRHLQAVGILINISRSDYKGKMVLFQVDNDAGCVGTRKFFPQAFLPERQAFMVNDYRVNSISFILIQPLLNGCTARGNGEDRNRPGRISAELDKAVTAVFKRKRQLNVQH